MTRVLIVDDEGGIRLALETLLRGEGYEVATAANVAAALERLAEAPFDVVVTDIVMPRGSGTDLLTAIAETEPYVQVILITGKPTIESAATAVRERAFDYLVKPVDGKSFLKAVAGAVRIKVLEDGRRRLEQENVRYRMNLEALVEERTQELRKAHEALAGHEERLRAILTALPDLVFVFDEECRYQQILAADDQLLYLPASSLVGRRVSEELPAREAELILATVRRTLETGTSQVLRYVLEVPAGRRWFEGRTSAMAGSREVVWVARDVTRVMEVQHKLMETEDGERRRIGQDLHDGLGQILTGIGFKSRALERKLEQAGREETAEAGEITSLVDQAKENTGRLLRGLVPPSLDAFGFMAALDELASTTEALFSIETAVKGDDLADVGDSAAMTHLYRIAQEAVNNAVRHGRPRHIEIRVDQREGELVMSIRDDGCGIAPQGERREGLGLRIMSYRAHIIGAFLDVGPAQDGGTVLTCTFQRRR